MLGALRDFVHIRKDTQQAALSQRGITGLAFVNLFLCKELARTKSHIASKYLRTCIPDQAMLPRCVG